MRTHERNTDAYLIAYDAEVVGPLGAEIGELRKRDLIQRKLFCKLKKLGQSLDREFFVFFSPSFPFSIRADLIFVTRFLSSIHRLENSRNQFARYPHILFRVIVIFSLRFQ